MAVLYLFTDILQHKAFQKLSTPFLWLGMNSITGKSLAPRGISMAQICMASLIGFTLPCRGAHLQG